MKNSTPSSSLSRYRPAILVLTGAAAAYAAYILYNASASSSAPSNGLHRSNAVRRPNARHRASRTTTIERLQNSAQPLGEFDFFGNAIPLDPRNLISMSELEEIARESQPGATPNFVEETIAQLYDTFMDRLLALTFPNAPLTTTERSAVTQWLGMQIPLQMAFSRALERHSARFNDGGAGAVIVSDEAESVAATELSMNSDSDSDDDALDSDGQTLQRTLYHIAEHRARQEGVIHRGITCNSCDTRPIRGVRWRCANCADYDLCSDCEANHSHNKTHIFYKIRIPAPYLGVPKQDPIYPGRPHVMAPSISSALRRKLLSDTDMETEELEALWDQFTCLAGTEWESDPSNVGWALDRRAFNQAFVPRYSSFISAPNLVYDRIFAYYDTDHNGMIGFEEFVKGLNGMHSTNVKVKQRIVFNGYDVDGDGLISRKDVLRMFRAYYAIEKEATRNYLAEAADELSVHGALETIQSSQPLGSAFPPNSLPLGRMPTNQNLQEKVSTGAEQSSLVRDDSEDIEGRDEILRMLNGRHEQNSLSEDARYEGMEQAVRERWDRRQFYIDEEEGFEQPEGVAGSPPDSEAMDETDGNADISPAVEAQRPRGSRSSSRVRFEDDVDVETRSNASTSSRVFGERWGGYEIPEPEKDLGKEVLYQITQQAFNELLDPLFQEKEDNAMDLAATRAERRRLQAQIEEVTTDFKRDTRINKAVLKLGVYRYTRWLLTVVITSEKAVKVFLDDVKNNQLGDSDIQDRLYTIISAAENEILEHTEVSETEETSNLELWNAMLCRMQLRSEIKAAILVAARGLKWLPPAQAPSLPVMPRNLGNGAAKEAPIMKRDPTMPQFRPNSFRNLELNVQDARVIIPGPNREQEAQLCASVSSEHDGSLEHDESAGILTNNQSCERPTAIDGQRPPSWTLRTTYYHTTAEPPFLVRSVEEDEISAPSERSPHASPAATIQQMIDILREQRSSESMLSRFNTSHPSLPDIADTVSHERSGAPHPPHSPNLRLSTDSQLSQNDNGHATIFYLLIKSDMTLFVGERPVEHSLGLEKATGSKSLARKVRHAAMQTDSPLYIAALASLGVVEAEIKERKGSGLVTYDEFEKIVEENGMRYLEAWLDWVSF